MIGLRSGISAVRWRSGGALGPKAIRDLVRMALHGSLVRVPLEALLPLRAAFASAPCGSARERLFGAALELVRLRGIPSGTFTLPDNPRVTFASNDSLILERIYWMGEKGWERHLMPWWRSLCRQSGVIVEIGANVGYYTVQGALASPCAKLIAVEPHPRSAAAIRSNLAANGITNVEFVEAAATNGEGPSELTLAMPTVDHFATPAGAFVKGRSEIGPRYKGVKTLQVRAVDVREVAADANLLKIDAEGMEYELLSALSVVIQDRKPTLIIELLDGVPALRGLLAELCASVGYELYVPSPRGISRIDAAAIPSVSIERVFGTRDVILHRGRLPSVGLEYFLPTDGKGSE